MKHLLLIITALLILMPRAQAADILTVADIQKVSGLSDIKTVEKNSVNGASGELNFAHKDGRLVCIVMIHSSSAFEAWKEKYGNNTDDMPDVGEAGFRTRPKATVNYVVFKKGDKTVWIQSMGWNVHFMQNFTADELEKLAKVAAGRM